MTAPARAGPARSVAGPGAGARYARVALTLALGWLGWRAFRHEYGYIPLLSDINLAIHEFGHLAFMPFGETLTILGGSLTQLLLPAVFFAFFLARRDGKRDAHAASVCLWWVAINLLSVAIYANDARAGRLMLITGETGQESDAHDWNNLFARWGVLHRDTAIAGHMRRLAWVLLLISVTWGLITAWTQHTLADPAPDGNVEGPVRDPG